jgi:hypothetical protein
VGGGTQQPCILRATGEQNAAACGERSCQASVLRGISADRGHVAMQPHSGANSIRVLCAGLPNQHRTQTQTSRVSGASERASGAKQTGGMLPLLGDSAHVTRSLQRGSGRAGAEGLRGARHSAALMLPYVSAVQLHRGKVSCCHHRESGPVVRRLHVGEILRQEVARRLQPPGRAAQRKQSGYSGSVCSGSVGESEMSVCVGGPRGPERSWPSAYRPPFELVTLS